MEDIIGKSAGSRVTPSLRGGPALAAANHSDTTMMGLRAAKVLDIGQPSPNLPFVAGLQVVWQCVLSVREEMMLVVHWESARQEGEGK